MGLPKKFLLDYSLLFWYLRLAVKILVESSRSFNYSCLIIINNSKELFKLKLDLGD